MFRKEEVEGRLVIETSGKALGKAKDIAFALDGSVALIVASGDNSEVQVAMDRITGVGEYIVVRREHKDEPSQKRSPRSGPAPAAQAPASPAPEPAPSATTPSSVVAPAVCRNCGSPLRPGARFCTKCGTAV